MENLDNLLLPLGVSLFGVAIIIVLFCETRLYREREEFIVIGYEIPGTPPPEYKENP